MAQMFGASPKVYVKAILERLTERALGYAAELEATFGDVLTFRGNIYSKACMPVGSLLVALQLFIFM